MSSVDKDVNKFRERVNAIQSSGSVKYEPNAAGAVAGSVQQSGPPQKKDSKLDQALDRMAERAQQVKAEFTSGPSNAPGLWSGPERDQGMEM
jgi:hypothetical protein